MEYGLISFSHKNSNIVDRDKLSFKDDKHLSLFMNRATSYLSEIMILNTCNRIEFFFTTSRPERAIHNLLKDISQYSTLDISKLEEMSAVFEKEKAIYHLFSVISSLDSLVVGETQIVGQIKDAFKFAFDNDFAGQKISRAIHYGFRCSASVRQQTAISKHKVSIASVAVSKGEEILGSLNGVKSLVIGSGEMSRLTAQYLFSKGAKVTIINRTRAKAEKIKEEIGEIEVEEFLKLSELINSHTLLFTATSSENPIITDTLIQDVNFKRYWFDLAVPKDIEEISKKEISIFRIDDLQDIVEKNREERREEIYNSHRIVGEYTEKFFQWISTLSVKPLIKKIYQKGDDAIKEEVAKAIKKGFIPPELEENVQKVAEQSIKKLLHGMSKNLKQISNDSSVDVVIESINYLFNFKDKKEIRNSYKCEYMDKDKNLLGQ